MSNLSDFLNQSSNGVGAFKNKIINGGFDVWQRGTSYACIAGEYYTADRWVTFNDAQGQFTVSKSSLDSSNAVKLTTDTITTDLSDSKYWHGMIQKIEAQNIYHLNGKQITISFKIKTNFTGTLPLCVRNCNYSRSYVTEFPVTSGIISTITKTVTLETDTILVNLNDLSTIIGFDNAGDFVTSTTDSWIDGNKPTTANCTHWSQIAGATIEIAQVQLEEGSVATEFEQRPLSIEEMLCYRYYEAGNHRGMVSMYSTAGFAPTIQFKVEKRIIPTVTVINGEFRPNGGNVQTPNSFSANAVSVNMCSTLYTAATSYAGQNGYCSYLYYADAEL